MKIQYKLKRLLLTILTIQIVKAKTEPEDIFIDDDDITMRLPKMELDGKTEIKPTLFQNSSPKKGKET